MTKVFLIAHGKSKTARAVQRQCSIHSQIFGLDLKYVFTERPGHAEALAKASAEYDWLIVCGGDGLNHEVINGLMSLPKDQRPFFSTIPGGSGNDFNRIFGRRTVAAVFENWKEGKSDKIAVLEMHFSGISRFALNLSTVGIGAAIAKTVNERKYRLPASLNYYFAIVQWLFSYQAPMIEIKNEDSGEVLPSTNTFLAAIGNGKFAGNGLGLCPQASISSNELALTQIGEVGILDFLRYQSTLKSCKQIDDSRVSYGKSSGLSLKVTRGFAHVEADGELICSLKEGEYIRYVKIADALTFV